MNLIIAAAAFAAVTGGSALAQPAGDTEALPAASAPTELPLATPALTRPLPSAPAPTVLKWYGWQVLLADGAAFGFAVLSRRAEVSVAWIGTGALVHAGNGHYGRAAASVGLRVALPLLGAAVGASGSGDCRGRLVCVGGIVAGALVGAGIAEVVDLVTAMDEHEVAPPRMSRSWTPVAGVRPSGATLGIAARF